MSKSLYDEVIGDAEIDIDCPKCEGSFDVTISQLGSTVTCPHCGQLVKLKKKGDSLSGIKSALDDLEKTFDSF